jgi:serine/threonine protein kinase
MLEVLGVGSTSTCHRCVELESGISRACKIVDFKSEIDHSGNHGMMDQFLTEIRTLRSLRHPNIIELYDVYISDDRIYIIMELMSGGELFDYVVQKGTLTEEEASGIVRKVTSALVYMHSRNVIHRDMKPENLLLAHKPRSSHDIEVKIIDFGLSKVRPMRGKGGNIQYIGECQNPSRHIYRVTFCSRICISPPPLKTMLSSLRCKILTDSPMATSFLGTRGYLAPEMIQRRDYTKSVDAWALGVIIFVLLCGCLPFDDDCQAIPNSPDLRHKFTLRFPRWAKDLSPSAKDLLGRLLNIDSRVRYTAEQAMDHPWVKGETASSDSLLQSPGRLRPSPGKNGKASSTEATRAHVSQMVANRAIANAQIAANYRSPVRQHVRKSSI